MVRLSHPFSSFFSRLDLSSLALAPSPSLRNATDGGARLDRLRLLLLSVYNVGPVSLHHVACVSTRAWVLLFLLSTGSCSTTAGPGYKGGVSRALG